MFVFHNKKIPYPAKTVVEDVADRIGEPDRNSFTPFTGIRDVLEGKLLRSKNVIVEKFSGKDLLSNNHKDFSTARIDTNGYNITSFRDLALGGDFATEQIVHDYVLSLFEQSLYYERNGAIRKYQLNSNSWNYLSFNKDDSVVLTDPTDLEVREERLDAFDEDVREAIDKLPYYLKMLQVYSRNTGLFLLSFLIAKSKIDNRRGDGLTYTAGTFTEMGIYRADSNGNISIKIENYKNFKGIQLKDTISLVCGNDITNPYYKACSSLIQICNILDIDLYAENPKDYDNNFMDSITINFLLNNEEFYNLYLKGIETTEQLFKPSSLYSIKPTKDSNISIGEEAFIMVLENYFFTIIKYGVETKRIDVENSELTNMLIANMFTGSNKAMKRYRLGLNGVDVRTVFILDADTGGYYKFRLQKGDYYKNREAIALVASTGHLILYAPDDFESDNVVIFITIYNYIIYKDGGQLTSERWERYCLSTNGIISI